LTNSSSQKPQPRFAIFVLIMSIMMAIPALSIDAMLPALPQIGSELNLQSANAPQLVVSAILLGMAVGQLIFGPLSDRIGRKPPVYIGFAIYIGGSVLAAVSISFPMLLAGRLLQGLGISGPRAVILALVRDLYKGRMMARVMSFVMTVFILVPMVAPSMGQAILLFSGWRTIFIAYIVIAVLAMISFGLRIPETLALERRSPFSLRRIAAATLEIVRNRTAIGYTISAGLISGAFLGYLNSAQQILGEQYALGERFPLVFSLVATSIGLASFLNSRLVMRYGMRFLVNLSLRLIAGLAAAGLTAALLMDGNPPLWVLLTYLMSSFFCVGILFGNQNALAMEPLGHLAGIGSAVVGSLSTLIQLPLGTIIGQSYKGTIVPLILGLGILAVAAILVVNWAERGEPTLAQDASGLS